jgi:hypothetical protein
VSCCNEANLVAVGLHQWVNVQFLLCERFKSEITYSKSSRELNDKAWSGRSPWSIVGLLSPCATLYIKWFYGDQMNSGNVTKCNVPLLQASLLTTIECQILVTMQNFRKAFLVRPASIDCDDSTTKHRRRSRLGPMKTTAVASTYVYPYGTCHFPVVIPCAECTQSP